MSVSRPLPCPSPRWGEGSRRAAAAGEGNLLRSTQMKTDLEFPYSEVHEVSDHLSILDSRTSAHGSIAGLRLFCAFNHKARRNQEVQPLADGTREQGHFEGWSLLLDVQRHG